MTTEREFNRARASHFVPEVDDDIAPNRITKSSRLDAPKHPQASGLIMRKAARDGNGVAEGADDLVATASSASGSALPTALMRKFESSLGADLSSVRVHTGAASADAAAAVGAKAYTVGQDIHFGAGYYDPSSSDGQHLLAHEVAHTVQQSGGSATRQNKLQVSAPHDAAEHEADRAADAMTSGQSFQIGGGAPVAARKVYRDADPDATQAPPEASPEMKEQADQFTANLLEGLARYREWRGNSAHTGHDVIAQQAMNAAAVAFNKNNIGSDAWEQWAGSGVAAKLSAADKADICEADSISGGNVMAIVRSTLSLPYTKPDHKYVMKLSSTTNGSLVDKALSALGTRVTITYTNAFAPSFHFTRDFTVSGLSVSAGVSVAATPRRFAQDHVEEQWGKTPSIFKFGKEAAKNFFHSLKDMEKEWAKDWLRSLGDRKHASTYEGSKPVDIGLDFDLLNLQIGADGIVADPVLEFWSPNDIIGAVLVPRLGRAELNVGPLDIRGVLMDAVTFQGTFGMFGALSFPNLKPTVTPPGQIVQGASSTTVGAIIDLKLVEMGAAWANLW